MVDSDTSRDASPKAETESPKAKQAGGDRGPGEMLRRAREASEQTPTDIARGLCLETRLIEAIEDDRYEAFGAAVFARGHVRRYAQALDLSVDEVLGAWDARYSAPPQPATPDPKVAPVEKRSGNGPMLAILLVLALVAIGAGFIWWWLHPPASEAPVVSAPRVEPAPRAERSPAFLDTSSTEIGPAAPATATLPGAESPSSYRLSGEVVQSPSVPAVAAADAAPVEDTVEVVTEEGTTSAPAAPEVAESVSVADALAAAGPAPVATGDEASLRFFFETECWVQVRDATGRTLMLGERTPGTVNDRTGVPPFAVVLGRYPGVTIEVDGEPFEVPPSAVSGTVARFEIPGR